MKTWEVFALVRGTMCQGQFDAQTPEEAIADAIAFGTPPAEFCPECGIDAVEVSEYTATEVK